MMKKFGLSVVLLLAMVAQVHAQEQTQVQVQVPSENHWGAFAVDMAPDTGKSGFGSSTQGAAQAIAQAMAVCKNEGGVDCVVTAQFKNTCGALAASSSGSAIYGVGVNAVLAQAEKQALATCEPSSSGENAQACTLISSQCVGVIAP